jgi:hypothetical protein
MLSAFRLMPIVPLQSLGGTFLRIHSLEGMRQSAVGLLLITYALGAPSPAAAQHHWKQYTDERGTRIEYPADLFVSRSARRSGRL